MNILLISYEFPPVGGGAGTVAKQTYEHLSNINISVDLIIGKPLLPSLRVFFAHELNRELKKFKIENYDLIILNDLQSIIFAGLHFSEDFLSRAIVIMHGSENELMFKKISFKNKFLGYDEAFRKTLQGCKNIHFVSEFLKNKFFEIDFFREKNIVDKSFVSYAGLDKSWLRNDWFERKPPSRNAIRFISVSRLTNSKGLDDSIKLIYLLNKNTGSNHTLDIFGDGPFLVRLKKLVNILGLEDNVKFKGKRTREQLIKEFSAYDVFLLLPKSQESFGLVFLEAASQGVPSISYNRYGMKESICHKKSGVLINDISEIQDALDCLCIGYNDYSKESIEFATEFNVSNFCRRWLFE